MGAVAIAVLWLGYAAGMWGYCMIRGYCITPLDVVDPGLPGRAVHWTGSEVPPGTTASVAPSNAAATATAPAAATATPAAAAPSINVPACFGISSANSGHAVR